MRKNRSNMIIILSVLLLWNFSNIAFAFNDWAEYSESSTPGAKDYNGYLSFLWRVVEANQTATHLEKEDIIKSRVMLDEDFNAESKKTEVQND